MLSPHRALCLVAAAAVLAPAGLVQAELAAPGGPVLLTVVGDIANTNRGAMDPAVDKLLAYHDQKFEAAAEFDLEALEELGMETRRFALDGLAEVQELEGPPLAAVLDAVGAEPGRITIMALDGFAVDLDAKLLEAHDWLVGLKRNGDYLDIGGFGPVWIAFSPVAMDRVATREESDLWPYQAFLIRVEAE